MKSFKRFGYVLMIFALMVIAAGCGGGNENADNGDENSGSLVVSGSSAMQPLIAAAAEEFMAENPNADVQVNAGGSGTGLSQVSEGSVDIGNSDVYAEEKEGIKADELVDHKVAVVGITAAVNPNVGITDISKEDLIKVFTGKITNWKDVGGKDQKIVLVNRPDSSGTRAVFNKFGLDDATPAEGITEDSSNTVKKILTETEGAVGYLAFSYFTDDSITALSVDGVEAKEENVQNGTFPIWAYQHSYTKGEPKGLTKSFLDYVMSEDIQSTLLKEQGYLPVTEMKVERDAEGNLKDL
ncbi:MULTISPECIES: phosphate ABC transporter substrate-binding protein [Bacillaceae]|uniref:phosphate ABC transporter substrate-binding protein n=1 Tax=Bacillaceae TaxID=186817 RepID=UPI001E44E6EE|nr:MULTISPECIES: phosphate ABC transporter substrate-binding protein [Bacillaceae]MCE4049049.1 phosphate ABC transporter substrate-binding protein [Bacillus sp. Au-Bac7]MCM3030942.1 phosphate ABC transporter substrate-binding protein [Niallia sp. MER 6]UPO90510.1 phosphate ABC transporter substrate-binding protein [Niallia sp. Man26]